MINFTADEQKLLAAVSRKDTVLQLIRAAIVDGRLPAGTRLDQNELAAQLGVSRMPVREALKQLETERLVVVYPYRGVEVSRLEPKEIFEMFEIRIALERLAVSRAATVMTPSHFSRLRAVLSEMDQHLVPVADGDPWMDLNQSFHGIMNDATGWPHLVETINQYRSNVERYVRYYFALRGREQSQKEHWDLLAACERRDIVAAQLTIEQHLRNTATTLVEAVEADGGDHKRQPA
ncbi:GntR family transcriptional regulator [Devosia sp. 1566]|uniref:GntR family transcriptional regulator n=1 Tax=Devosia sp. 1566 TaxID=2499144 RepID=UPI000FDA8F9D|nr:GntR family transcriptional regulator [Devosia sp. 1566]